MGTRPLRWGGRRRRTQLRCAPAKTVKRIRARLTHPLQLTKLTQYGKRGPKRLMVIGLPPDEQEEVPDDSAAAESDDGSVLYSEGELESPEPGVEDPDDDGYGLDAGLMQDGPLEFGEAMMADSEDEPEPWMTM